MKTNDLLIEMISYSKNKLPDLVNPVEMFNQLKDKYNLEENHRKELFISNFAQTHAPEGEVSTERKEVLEQLNNTKYQDRKYTLDVNAYFQELEYTELQEARESSKKSLNRSTIAIIISIITIIISILFTLFGTTNVRLQENNVDSINSVLKQISDIHNLIIQKSEI